MKLLQKFTKYIKKNKHSIQCDKKLSTKSIIVQKIGKSFLSCLILAVAVFFFDVECVFRNITGFPCLGCGSTRACISLLHGDFAESFYWHPLYPITLIILLSAFVNRGTFFKNKKLNSLFAVVIFTLYFGVYIVRMIKYFPDTAPMNYNYQSILWQIYQFIK